MPPWIRAFLRWTFSNLAWWLFWISGAVIVTAVFGAVSGLEGWWLVAFTIGVFGVAFSALYGGSRIALNVIPDQWTQRKQPQESGGFAAGLLGMAAVEERKKLRAAVQRIAGEIAYGRKMLEEAKATNRYWNPHARSLVNERWVELSQLLAEAPEALEAYRHAESAYHEFDRVNHVVVERAFQLANVPHPPVWDGDRLDQGIGAAVIAESELTDAAEDL